MSEIKFILNGEEKTLPQKITISELIAKYNLDIRKIAIEKNLEIVNKKDFDKIFVENGNKIEIVHFIGGG